MIDGTKSSIKILTDINVKGNHEKYPGQVILSLFWKQ